MIAVLVGLVATLLGGAVSGGPELKLNIDASGAHANFQFAGQTIFSTGGGLNSDIGAFLVGSAIYITIAAIVMAVVYFVLAALSALAMPASIWIWWIVASLLLRPCSASSPMEDCRCRKAAPEVYVLLWSLLLIIPGIIATYSYAMTEFILAEHPDLTASEAIAQSKEMMSGNRWRLFCLHFSFIGWDILSSLTLGIGNLWLRPYKQAANAAFYREISGTGYAAFDPSYS